MSKSISSLYVGITGNISGLARSFGQAITPVKSLTGSIRTASSSLSSITGNMLKFAGVGAAVAAGMGALRSTMGGLTDSISLASQLEQDQVAFETMLGSASKAQSVLAGLQQFAAATPFDMPGVVKAGRQILAFGIDADKLNPTLKMVGDIAAGVGAPLGDIAYLFGTIKTQGKAMTVDIRQFANRGIPIYDSLAKVLHTTTAGVQEMVTAGKVGFPEIQAAFAQMTGEGGRFAGLMEKQSHTLGGLWSTLKDNVGMGLAGIATTIIKAFNIKGGIAVLGNGLQAAFATINTWVTKIAAVVTSWAGSIASVWNGAMQAVGLGSVTAAQAIQYIVVAVSAAATAYGAFIGVSLALAAVQGTIKLATIAYSGALAIVRVATVAWTAVQWLLNAALTANPVGIMVVALGALVAGIGYVIAKTVGLNTILAAASTAFSYVAYAAIHFKDTVKLAAVAAAYDVVKFANQVQYVFTEQLPAYLIWFADNWRSIWQTMLDFTASVLVNLWTNVTNFFSGLKSLLKGDGFDFKWTGLTEGFKSSIAELPVIAKRQAGPLEKQLGKQVDDLAAQWIKGFDDAHKAAIAKPTEVKAPEIPKPIIPQPDPIKLDVGLNQDDLTVNVTPVLKRAKAIQVGSAEAQLMDMGLSLDPQAVAASTPGPTPARMATSEGTTPIQPAQPQAAAQPVASQGMKDAVAELTKRMVDELVKHTGLLTKIAAQDSAPMATATF